MANNGNMMSGGLTLREHVERGDVVLGDQLWLLAHGFGDWEVFENEMGFFLVCTEDHDGDEDGG